MPCTRLLPSTHAAVTYWPAPGAVHDEATAFDPSDDALPAWHTVEVYEPEGGVPQVVVAVSLPTLDVEPLTQTAVT